MFPLKATRRRFFALMGTTPLAAKAAVDAQISQVTTLGGVPGGFGNASLSLPFGGGPAAENESAVSYEQRLTAAADYLRLLGRLPETVEFTLRDNARYVIGLDPDIACKRAWSMSVKIMTQRQRNYERGLQRIMESGRHQRERNVLKAVLGFAWPW